MNHAAHKRLTVDFLNALAGAQPDAIEAVLARYCHADAVFEIFHPFNRLEGIAAADEGFWRPLKAAFPDYEQRFGLVIGGEYEGRAMVSTLGHVLATFTAPWLGIPPTHGMVYLRFGVNLYLVQGRIAKVYVLLDIVDVMRQAGFYPLRRMPGSAEQWPLPPCEAAAAVDAHDAANGEHALRIVREMQLGLPAGEEMKKLATERGKHSPRWHQNMNWYGPAGIGSTRGEKGFINLHGALFVQAFPDRAGIVRDPDGPEDAAGHYIRAGDGRLVVTGGWPSIRATHLGGEWLGLPPSGRPVEMRVADWYRLDADDRIIDNWVMIDIPHILAQAGLDLLDDLRYFADPTLPRFPR